VAGAESAGLEPDLQGLAGLGRRSPALALPLAVFMVSLTGLPPTAGFIAKFAVFRQALQDGCLWLVLIAVAASVVSVGYYLRLLVPVFMGASEEKADRIHAPVECVMVAVFLAAALLAAGVLPRLLLAFGGLANAG